MRPTTLHQYVYGDIDADRGREGENKRFKLKLFFNKNKKILFLATH